MASYPSTLPYRPLTPGVSTNPIGFNNTNDPRKLAQNQRQYVAGQGDALQRTDEDLANQYLVQSSGTQSYLDPIEQNLAEGGGGYDPAESAAINLSPEDKQNLITNAGISSGVNTAASVSAAERAAAAAGGNPSALATYRARAAQTQGATAGDAMTNARTQAKQLEAAGAKTTGDARLGQQDKALTYYGGLQDQQNQAGLTAKGLQHQAYGTETSGTNAAADTGLKASQTPSTFDKVTGLVAGAAKAFLGDGTPGYLADGDANGGIDAVLGEDGPEAIIEAASDPVRSDTSFMADGDIGDGLPMASGDYGATAAASEMAPVKGPSWRERILSLAGGNQAPAQQKPAEQWNKTTPYSQAGDAIGSIAKVFMQADGGIAPGGPKIITSPTHVRLAPSDQVVPLSYRPQAKVRPSAALPAMAPRMRQAYGSPRA